MVDKDIEHWAKVRRQGDIHDFCRRLEYAWSLQPELRLGQLVANGNTVMTSPRPMFYMNDDVLLMAIEKFCGVERDA